MRPRTVVSFTTSRARIPEIIMSCSASSTCRSGDTVTGRSHEKSVIAARPGEFRVNSGTRGLPRCIVAGNDALELTYGLNMSMLLCDSMQTDSYRIQGFHTEDGDRRYDIVPVWTFHRCLRPAENRNHGRGA